jgi:hypothetical protein
MEVGGEFAAEERLEDFGFFGFSDVEIEGIAGGEALGGDDFTGGLFEEDGGSFHVRSPFDIEAAADELCAGRERALMNGGAASDDQAEKNEWGQGEEKLFSGHKWIEARGGRDARGIIGE